MDYEDAELCGRNSLQFKRLCPDEFNLSANLESVHILSKASAKQTLFSQMKNLNWRPNISAGD